VEGRGLAEGKLGALPKVAFHERPNLVNPLHHTHVSVSRNPPDQSLSLERVNAEPLLPTHELSILDTELITQRNKPIPLC
jgi:hypothetical protein